MEDDFDLGAKVGNAPSFIDIRSQQRNGRKCITLVQGIPTQFSLNKIMRYLKKSFNCNGSIVVDEEYGAILQLQGDRRKEIAEFLFHEGIAEKDHIRVHGT